MVAGVPRNPKHSRVNLPDRHRILLALPMLAIIAIIAGVALQWKSSEPSLARTDTNPLEADYFLYQAKIHRYDSDGALIHSLRAERLEHFPDESARLVNVAVTRMAGPWTLQAEQGLAPEGLSELVLQGDVRLSTLVNNETPATVKTEILRVDIAGEKLESLAPVTVQSGTTTAHANRMFASLRNQNIELEGEVRVEHKP